MKPRRPLMPFIGLMPLAEVVADHQTDVLQRSDAKHTVVDRSVGSVTGGGVGHAGIQRVATLSWLLICYSSNSINGAIQNYAVTLKQERCRYSDSFIFKKIR